MLKGRFLTYKMRFTSGGSLCRAPGVPAPEPIPGVIMGVAMPASCGTQAMPRSGLTKRHTRSGLELLRLQELDRTRYTPSSRALVLLRQGTAPRTETVERNDEHAMMSNQPITCPERFAEGA
jgi:hypothetical protein